MPLLSLRATISALSALSVAIVAAITLSITLTTSLAALRSIGKTHSTALLSNAQLQTEGLFHRPAIAGEAIKNITLFDKWPWPSDDPSTLQRFREATLDQYLAAEYYVDVNIFFADSTRMGGSSFDDDYYISDLVSVAPYSKGGTAYQVTQPSSYNMVARLKSDHSIAPPSAKAWNYPYPAGVMRATSFWNSTVLPATINGYASTTPGLYAIARYGTVDVLLVVAVPLYTKGSPKGPDSLYGVMTGSVRIDSIPRFLRGIAGTAHTESFAYDNGGYLIGASTPQPYQTSTVVDPTTLASPGCSSTAGQAAIGNSNVTTMICRAHISKYGRDALTELSSKTDFAFSAVNAVQLIEVGGDVYYAAVSPVKLPYPGIGVWLALVMPEADVIGDVVTGRNTAIGVTCGVFLLATATTFVAIALLLRPLSTIADRMMLAATLEDDGSAGSEELSSMAEVEDLQQAYYAMNEELNRIKSFVPQTVLQRKQPLPAEENETTTATDDDARTGDTVSRRSARSIASKRSGRSHVSGVNAAGGGSGALNVLCGVGAQSVSVVAANLSGFEEAAWNASRDALVLGVADAVRLVHEVAAAQKGVVQSFHGDHFVVTFNAVTACAAHARRGAVAALQLVAQAPSVGLKLPFRAGVATGKCLVGNLGSSEAKTFNTIGPAYVHAGLLERMTRQYGAGCRVLAPRRTCVDVATHVKFRYVDMVQLPHSKTPVLIGALLREIDTAAARGAHDQVDAEWLYVVDGAASDESVYHLANEAFVALADGRTADADELTKRIEASNEVIDNTMIRSAYQTHRDRIRTDTSPSSN